MDLFLDKSMNSGDSMAEGEIPSEYDAVEQPDKGGRHDLAKKASVKQHKQKQRQK